MSRYTISQAKTTVGTTDWKKVDAMTEKQLEAVARSDPDARPATSYQLTQYKPLKFLKHKLGL